MKKVLLINDFNYEGGAETVFRTTYELLERTEGIEVRKFYGSIKYSKPKSALAYLYSRYYKRALDKVLLEERPDIVHIHGYYHILSPSIFLSIKKYKKKRQIKVIYTAHDYHFLYPNSSLLKYHGHRPVIARPFSIKSFLWERVDHRGVIFSILKKMQWVIAHVVLRIKNEIDLFLSPSSFLRDLYMATLKVPVRLLRNPIELSFVEPNKPIKANEQIRLIYFGRISKEKGILEFVTKVKKSNENFILDIYGTGELENQLSKYISSEQLTDKVFLKGSIGHNKLMNILSSYHAMVMPSIWYENAPMSIVEAAVKGVMILASDIGGVAELSKLCGNYVLFDPYNVEIDSLLKEMHEIHLIDRLGRLNDFDFDHYLTGVLDSYND